MTHGDEIVADRPEADPNFHAVVAFVAAAVQSMAPLEHANPAFASGSPLLPLLEPACLLQLSSLLALGGAVRHLSLPCRGPPSPRAPSKTPRLPPQGEERDPGVPDAPRWLAPAVQSRSAVSRTLHNW